MEESGLRPSRQLGQNFLADDGLCAWIAGRLEAGPDDCVVEVGPGFGALSRHLAGRVRRLVLVEFDRRLAAWLEGRFAGVPGVEVVHADGARFDPRALFPEGPVLFLGNLPYSSGSAILANFFRRESPVARGVVMLQSEFIGRMAAAPRTKDYGALSVRLQSEWQVTRLREVGPDAFVPRPRVDSSVARLDPVPPGARPPFDARLLDRLLRLGFAQRRKQLHKQLPVPAAAWPGLATALGLPATARAEELAVDQWIELARRLDPHPLAATAQRADECFDVVDENDRVTGRERRDVVHRLGLRHRAVHVFVFNRRGEILLQKRSRLKDNNPGLWDSSVSGHVDAGEDYAACATRELAEEMGIHGCVPREVARVAACAATGEEFVRVFHAGWDGTPVYPSAEIDAALWAPLPLLRAWLAARPDDFSPGFRACWQAGAPG
jgi:16S rRNA (adenine1518-N6/adenine1519-N6)-dimethyltransferase